MNEIKTIVEKAAAYDKAFEIAKAKYSMQDQPIHQDLVDIFPELADSEDEKIRKYLIELIKEERDTKSFNRIGINNDKIIAWLEKQKKVINREPFKIGDIVTNGFYEGMVVGTAYDLGWFTVKCDRATPPIFPVLALHYDAWQKVDDKIEAVEQELEKSEERLGITKKEFEEELEHFYHYADEVQYTRGYDKGISEARKQIVEEIDIDAMVDDYSNHLHEWGSVSVYKQAI